MVDAPIPPMIAVDGPLTAAISNAVVGLLRDFTGRGPTQARTTIGSDTVVVTLRDSLTKAERTLGRAAKRWRCSRCAAPSRTRCARTSSPPWSA